MARRSRRRWLALGLLAVVGLVVGALVWSSGTGRGGLTVVVPAVEAAVGQTSQSAAGAADPPVTVVRRDFQIRLSFDAQTVAGSSVVLSPHPGLAAVVPSWQRMAEPGEVIGDLRLAPAVVAASQAAPGAVTDAQLALLRGQTGRLKTPVVGAIRHQGAGPVIDAPGIDLVAALSGLQDLRFRSAAFTGNATVETVLGQRTIPCAWLWLAAPATDGSDTQAGESQAGSQLHCRLPASAETAPGLRGRLTIASAPVKDAIVVPNRYLQYRPKADSYTVSVHRGDAVTRVKVAVGATDGVARVVTSKLWVGAELVLPEASETAW